MVQKVLAPDEFGNQVFRWDKQHNTLSLVHSGAVLFYELGDDNEFHYIKSEAKSKPEGKRRTA
jgi:hypothetical protein